VEALLSAGFPAGRVVVDRAGHDPVDSSVSSFRTAAGLLVVALAAIATGGDVEALARDAIRRW
jgi:hypothetical protein